MPTVNTKTVTVRVPGTSANCAAGFDTLGLACTIYNDLELSLSTEPGVTIVNTGEGADELPTDETNAVWQSVRALLRHAGREEFVGGALRVHSNVPLARGLGSSATAIVAGLKAANILIDSPFSRSELLQFATELEGHPDNVAPAIYGGFTVNVSHEGRVETFAFLPKLPLKLVVAIPDFPLETKAARAALPAVVPLRDAVFNVGHAAMLVAALIRGTPRFLSYALDDALHQPYRAHLIPGMAEVFAAATAAGALGCCVSGAGPTLIAFTLEREAQVGEAMVAAFARAGVAAEFRVLGIDQRGACLVRNAGGLAE